MMPERGLGGVMTSLKRRQVGAALIGALIGVPAPALAQADAPKPDAPKPAAAQPAPPQQEPGKAKTVETITVTGAAPDTQRSIDRQSYTLGKDLAATTGSIGDALRNLP